VLTWEDWLEHHPPMIALIHFLIAILAELGR
jgi:hypothetical protein